MATSLEQVMSYYRRTVTLQDTLYGWKTEHYTIEDVLPGTSVDTRLIRDDYDTDFCTEEETDAVARLSYYCGVAAKMNYGLRESGADIQTLIDPLKRAFGWATVKYLDSYLYTPGAWRAILENEIRNGRPVYMTGHMQTLGGHAFVLDGLDETGNFHVNWSYGGHYDGYTPLDVLHAFEPLYDRTTFGDRYGFSCNMQALILHPDSIPLVLPQELQRTGYEVVIDSLRFVQQPEVGKYTETLVYLHNSSSDSLITPFAIIANSPADTAIFEQADVLGLIGTVLAPGEKAAVSVPLRFNTAGNRVVRLSPADTILVSEQSVFVNERKRPAPVYGEPVVNFPQDSVAQILVPISNVNGAGRMGEILTYSLFEGEVPESEDGDVRHPKLCTLVAGAEMTDTVCFHGLKPNVEYTFCVRAAAWTPEVRCTFTVPETAGVDDVICDDVLSEEGAVYTIDGRRIEKAGAPGIYIKRGKKFVIK